MARKLLAALAASFMIVGLFGGAALAGHEEKDGPGPNGHNNKGLCTAYFNGQKKGHDKKDEPPGPFAALEEAADPDSTDEDPATIEEIIEFCGGAENIGGNPDHGRFASCFDAEEDDTPCANSNDA